MPFLAFGPATRKVIYTTNSIESLNYQLRKVTKNRGHYFPNDAAAVKLLWLAVRNIEDQRARERAKEAGRKTCPWQIVPASPPQLVAFTGYRGSTAKRQHTTRVSSSNWSSP